MSRSLFLAAASLAILALAASVGPLRAADLPASVSDKSAPYKLQPGPFKVQTIKELILKDAKRHKDLQLRINSPDGKGPFPLIVFSHGTLGSKDHYLVLTEHWASHGYVTIQANHSDSHAVGAKMGDIRLFLDWQSRPADVSFILDALDELEKQESVRGKIDRKRIGVGGHSFGAHTALLVGGARVLKGDKESFEDERVSAVLALSPPWLERQISEKSFEKFARPMLLMSGSEDVDPRFTKDATLHKRAYEWSPSGDKYLVWVEGMDHGFGGIAGNPLRTKNEDHVSYAKIASLAFWDSYLLPGKEASREALAYLKSDRLPGFSKRGELKLDRK